MRKNTDPTFGLNPEQIEEFGQKMEALRNRVVAELGPREAQYIRRVQQGVRYSEIGGRALLMAGWFPPAWIAGAALLSASKIVDNMELGHNVMHGQYDWMNDPSLDGQTYEWDSACDGDAWRHFHNYIHHTYTNVEGMDRDIGYAMLRLTDEQRWTPLAMFQPLAALILALNFQWGVALHDLETEWVLEGKKPLRTWWKEVKPVARKGLRQLAKDYLFFPALAGPAALPVLAGNATANLSRNLWAFAIIFCGHFTEDAETFDETVVDTETRGQWYLRQILGSSNLDGSDLFHFMSGNLSHQIEHHLFPDVPAVRYKEMAAEVRAICEEYGVQYNTGPFGRQFSSVIRRILRYSLPTRAAADTGGSTQGSAALPPVEPLAA